MSYNDVFNSIIFKIRNNFYGKSLKDKRVKFKGISYMRKKPIKLIILDETEED